MFPSETLRKIFSALRENRIYCKGQSRRRPLPVNFNFMQTVGEHLDAPATNGLIKTIPDRRRAGACSRRNERVKINLTFIIIKAMLQIAFSSGRRWLSGAKSDEVFLYYFFEYNNSIND